MRSDRAELIAAVCDYTLRERNDDNVGEPDMVDLWLRICRLASKVRRARDNASMKRAATRATVVVARKAGRGRR